MQDILTQDLAGHQKAIQTVVNIIKINIINVSSVFGKPQIRYTSVDSTTRNSESDIITPEDLLTGFDYKSVESMRIGLKVKDHSNKILYVDIVTKDEHYLREYFEMQFAEFAIPVSVPMDILGEKNVTRLAEMNAYSNRRYYGKDERKVLVAIMSLVESSLPSRYDTVGWWGKDDEGESFSENALQCDFNLRRYFLWENASIYVNSKSEIFMHNYANTLHIGSQYYAKWLVDINDKLKPVRLQG